MDGIERSLPLPPPAEVNFFDAPGEIRSAFRTLPTTPSQAKQAARESDFIASVLPKEIIDAYTA